MMRQFVPTYGLYGEENAGYGDFWIHSESIKSRSQVYDWEIRPHRHDAFFQILHIRSGEGELLSDEGTIGLGAGSVVTVPPGTSHGFRFSSDIDGHVLTFLASRLPAPGSGIVSLMDQPRAMRLDISGEGLSDNRVGMKDAVLIRELLARITDEVAAGFGGRSDFVQACVVAVLTLIARRGATGEGQDQAAGRDMIRLESLQDLIGLHFREQLPIDFYARKLGLTPTHLNRIVRRLTGHPVGRLINDRIMEEARRDLVFTSMTVQQIAYELGFSDPAYFNRFFSRQLGMTPKAYRGLERERLMVGK
jgi:AraC family transcriptional regulator, transcriptional activator of pobA